MSEHFDAKATQERYRLLTDEKLIEIAFLTTTGYIPEAKELARAELEGRGVTAESHPQQVALAASTIKSNQAAAKNPASIWVKIVCVLIPGLIIPLIIAGFYLASGKKRAAGQTVLWAFIGLGAWVLFAYVMAHV